MWLINYEALSFFAECVNGLSDETSNKSLKLVFTGQKSVCQTVRWLLVKHLVISRSKLKFCNSLINYITFEPSICRTIRRAPVFKVEGLVDHWHGPRLRWLLDRARITKPLNPWISKSIPCGIQSSGTIKPQKTTVNHVEPLHCLPLLPRANHVIIV